MCSGPSGSSQNAPVTKDRGTTKSSGTKLTTIGPFPLPLPDARYVPASVAVFEVSLSASAAGCLLPLVFFPVLGAGLVAWGGMAVGQPAPGNGGGGGGGSGGPVPPSPPAGGLSEEPEEEYVLQLAGVGSGAGSTNAVIVEWPS